MNEYSIRPKHIKIDDVLVVKWEDHEEEPVPSSPSTMTVRTRAQSINQIKPQTPTAYLKENGVLTRREKQDLIMKDAASKIVEIPTPTFRLVDDYEATENARKPFSRTDFYVQHNETLPEELMAKVAEYDMDEVDEQFLSSINSNKVVLTDDKFEFLMDRLEAEACVVDDGLPSFEEVQSLFSSLPEEVLSNVYEHWLKRRAECGGQHLIPKLQPPSYIKTRKGRNDVSLYKKMWYLRQTMETARTLLEMLRKREKLKRDLILSQLDLFDQQVIGTVSEEVTETPVETIEVAHPRKRKYDEHEPEIKASETEVHSVDLSSPSSETETYEAEDHELSESSMNSPDIVPTPILSSSSNSAIVEIKNEISKIKSEFHKSSELTLRASCHKRIKRLPTTPTFSSKVQPEESRIFSPAVLSEFGPLTSESDQDILLLDAPDCINPPRDHVVSFDLRSRSPRNSPNPYKW